MAAELIFICDCGFGISVWDDGNPYYLDPGKFDKPRSRQKVYTYHPADPPWPIEGNDVPHICMSCCHEFMVDNKFGSAILAFQTKCTKCKSEDIVDCLDLTGKLCPKCKKKKLEVRGGAIS